MHDRYIEMLRIDEILSKAWAARGNGFKQSAIDLGRAWHNAALAHDYENLDSVLPQAVALSKSRRDI